MRFLIDTQLPAALARWLEAKGHHAEHVLDVNMGQSQDNPIWLYALANEAVIVTKDEDFAEWVMNGRQGPAVVWLRLGNSSKQALFLWLEKLLPIILEELSNGERLIEVL